MKKSLFLAGILSLTALQAIAQNQSGLSFADLMAKIPHQSQGPSRVNVSKPLKGANYNWDSNGANWTAIDSTFYTYNSQGLITQESNGSNASTLTYRQTTTYDANYRVTEFLSEIYDAGLSAWVNAQKHTEAYDAQGNTTSDEYFSYNVGLSQWDITSGSLYAYTYNGQNQILTRTAQEYNSTLAIYVNDYREINYTYNSFGNPLSWDEEEWDGVQWVPTAKYFYVYDANGFPTEAEVQEWDATSSAFVPVQKYTDVLWYNWTGDINDGLVAYTLNLGYNTATSAWDTTGQTTTTYGVNDSYVQLDEVYSNGVFVNDYRATANIDYQGRSTLEGGDNWNTSTNTWDVSWQEANTYTYDVNDNLTQRINQYWNQSSMMLVNNIRNDYADFQTFDNTTGLFSNEAGTLSVYPNPMHELVTISTDQLTENVTIIQLVDLNGTVVKTIDNINGTTTEISRDALKSGLYFVQVKSGSTVLAMTKLLVD